MKRNYRAQYFTASDRREENSGFTLIEVVVSMLVLGLGVTAILGALAVGVSGSSLHRNQSDIDSALSSAAETVKTATYLSCGALTAIAPPNPPYNATPASGPYSGWPSYSTAPATSTTGYFVVTVQYWNGSSFYSVPFSGPCPPAIAGFDDEAVTVDATSAGGQVHQIVTVVKGSRT